MRPVVASPILPGARNLPPTITTTWPTVTAGGACSQGAQTRRDQTLTPRPPSTMAGAHLCFWDASTRRQTILRPSTTWKMARARTADVKMLVHPTTTCAPPSMMARARADGSCSAAVTRTRTGSWPLAAAMIPRPITIRRRRPTMMACACTSFLAARTRRRPTTSPPPSKSGRPPTAPSPSMAARSQARRCLARMGSRSQAFPPSTSTQRQPC